MKNAFALPFSMVNESDGAARNDKRVEVYSIMAMLGVFSFVGIVGNAIVIFVYTRGKMGQGQQQTATVFIVTLAIGDLIASSMTMPFTMAFEYTEYGFSNLFTCRLYGLLLTSTIPFSSLVMVGIAIDRYLCICHPFKRLMNVPRAIAMVMLFTAIACTYGALGSTLYNVILDPDCNETFYTNSSSNSSYWEDYVLPSDYDYYTAGTERNLSIGASVAGAETTTSSSIDSLSSCRLLCDENGAGEEFIFQLYQNFNFGLFMVVVLIVSVLYTLIYMSVSNQRRKKSRMLGRGRSTVTNNEDDTQDLRFMTESSTGSGSTGRNGSEANGHSRKQGTLKKLSLAYKKQSMVTRDEVHKGRQGDERMRNLKMAFMLFIVTIVFVISFMPCIILLIISIVDPGASTPGVLFYLYFMMNAANPVIYCFMNPNFRQSLNVLFRRK